MFHLIKKQPSTYWIDLLKKNGHKTTHVDHNQLDPLPFKIIYTIIRGGWVWLHRHSVILTEFFFCAASLQP